ncbi:MAG: TetR/AcrR family transcriptional regulator [Candidatus Electryoneaceae bacterium]|nr:TetR/AcrR family transcriptional regulator [Candidatus Electryoneaceae bacterium]
MTPQEFDADRKQPNDPKQQFYKVAEPLFERYGFRKTTVEEICKATGASKRTFYELFSDKGDIFINLVINISERELRKWAVHLPDDLDPYGQLESFIDFYVEVLARRQVFKIFFEEPDLFTKLSNVPDMRQSPMFITLMDLLDRGVKSGQFRRLDSESAVWIVFTILDSMYFLLPMMSNVKGAGDNPVLASEVKQFILNAVGVKR